MPNTEHLPRNSSGRQLAIGIGATLTAGLAVTGLVKLSNHEMRGTEFASSADAMRALKANAAAHKDDDYTDPAQGRMERDLRGADPLIMKDLGAQVVSAAAVHSGDYKTKDGKTVKINITPYKNHESLTTIEVVDLKQDDDSTLTLTRSEQGDLLELTYDEDMVNKTTAFGGQHFNYDYSKNELIDSNTFQYTDGSPMPGTPAAIIVNDSETFGYYPAGQATDILVGDFASAQNLLNLTDQLPLK